MSSTRRVAILHKTSQAQRPHVGPHFLDERQALCLGTALPRVAPPERVLAVGRPDGVLLFVVQYDLVDRRAFFLLLEHVTSRGFVRLTDDEPALGPSGVSFEQCSL